METRVILELIILEWVTQSENRKHAYETGLQNGLSRRGKLNNFTKLTEEQVKFIKENYSGDVRLIPRKQRHKYWTAKRFAEKFNVTEGCIQAILKDRNWDWL